MKNLNELKNEYLGIQERIYEVDKELDDNMKEFLAYEKNDDFIYIESEMFRDLVEYHVDDMTDEDPDFEMPDMDKLEEEYYKWVEHLKEKVHERIALYDKREKLINERSEWTRKNDPDNLHWEWNKEAKVYKGKWYGWSSNDLVNMAMYLSIDMIDEEEVKKVIDDARKVYELIGDDGYYSSGYVHDLEFINTKIRHYEDVGIDIYFVLDCLENDGVWDIYRESFAGFVKNVKAYVDIDYLEYLEDLKYEE